ncbi:MAG: UDP-glucose 4-epimerase GalE [Cytophagales bacterium]|nr:UDP-glucose 4-epimerase GalE [Cytophagales bacterium]
MTKQKILVTGGLGYIGSHTVVELIHEGYEVLIIDDLSNSDISVHDRLQHLTNSSIEFIQGDLSDPAFTKSLFEKTEISGVIHFAAKKAVGESVEQPLLYYRVNVGSLINVLEEMSRHDVGNLIFSSSCTVYGQPDKLPVTEKTPFKETASPYGYTKKVCEEVINNLTSANPNLFATSLRYFNPVGAHESAEIGELPIGIPNNLVPFITQSAAGIREDLKVFGGDYTTPDGTAIRDYIHVVDLAKAHVQALNRQKTTDSNYEIFNIGTGSGYSVLEVIQSFIKVSGKPLTYKIVDRRAGDIEQIFADTTYANEVLGWKSEKTIDDMMSDAWRWQLALGQ